ncbi:hypothetical protein [Bartonella rattaustraliani]|uniref:hypothetical protein n=1 Tax=Bartonella rattaustraliani TaxID=481139 RepID=UPI00037BFB34|nr:hypothetical protein [Bartonella rattaustraliani]
MDTNTEVFDDQDQEDEEDEDNEEKDEDVRAILAKERRRAGALTALEKQAQSLGVSFNAAQAIKNGMSLEKAKKIVLDTAVSRSTSLKLSPIAPHGDGTSKGKIHTKWETIWKGIK